MPVHTYVCSSSYYYYYPQAGRVSCGKSSLFKRLLGLRREDARVRIGETGGTTRSLVWAALPGKASKRSRRLLVDLPGTGQAAGGQSEADRRVIKKIIQKGMKRMDVCVLVVGATVDKETQKLHQLLLRCPYVSPDRMLVALTRTDILTTEAIRDRISQCCELLPGVTRDRIFVVSAASSTLRLTPAEVAESKIEARRPASSIVVA